MKINRINITAFLLMLFALQLTACGGGGGGGGTSSSGVTYNGVTTQAAVDGSNAEGLTTGAYEGGQIGGAVNLGAVAETHSGRSHYLDLSLAINSAVRQFDFQAASGVVDLGMMNEGSDTIPGPNGGHAQVSLSVDNATGDFTGSVTFVGYTDTGTVMTGSAAFSGEVDLNTKSMKSFIITGDDISVSMDGASFTAKMDITFNYSGSQFTSTMNMVLRDGSTGKTYQLKNFAMTVSDKGGYAEFICSGTYYDHDYGYVDISTPTSFKMVAGSSYPYEGVMLVAGKDGSKARLTALSAGTFKVEADADGDGIYEWPADSGTSGIGAPLTPPSLQTW